MQGTLQSDLSALLDELERSESLWHAEAFAARAAALDRLELLTFGLAEATGQPERAGSPQAISPAADASAGHRDLTDVRPRADAMGERLAGANWELCQRLRAAIRSGALRGGEARRTLERLAGLDAGSAGEYGVLDSLVSALLLDAQAPGAPPGAPPVATLPPDPERVPYQPAPARVVLELLDHVSLGPDDVFYDLGSGLGQVCTLVHLLTGAEARGIEIEPTYCRYAREQASALGLAGVEVVEGDVREVELAGGTCYFLYTPFSGRTLAEALDHLAAAGLDRGVFVAAYGPCVAVVARQPWLEAIEAQPDSGLAIFRVA